MKTTAGNNKTGVRFRLTVIKGKQTTLSNYSGRLYHSWSLPIQPGGQLSAQLAGALALSATDFSPGQVERARAGLAAAACLLVVRVEAARGRRAREAGRRAAAAQATSSPAATVLVAGGRGADGALQRGGAARGCARAAMVVRRAR